MTESQARAYLTTATFTLRGEEYTVRAGSAVRDALLKLNLSPDAYLVVRGDELITDDVLIEPGETLRVLPVISGGASTA